MKKRNVWLLVSGSILFLAGLIVMWFDFSSLSGKDEVITVGVFSDSYWEVQNGYSYQILEDAIALFEEEHPGVK
ncbi:MAG: hypothetical protein K2G39_08770, partial [Lachnospiraceae bacterium]|nr:hypothetical protein [Lachnospiraceae bacterium]